MKSEKLVEDEIISIEECGEHDTIDIEVDGDHLFFANDILTHNSGYDKKENMSLTHMSESIKKVEHSDFVGMIRSEDRMDEQGMSIVTGIGEMMVTIGKNRSGAKNKCIKLQTNFSCFRIDSQRPDVTTIPFEMKNMDIMPNALL